MVWFVGEPSSDDKGGFSGIKLYRSICECKRREATNSIFLTVKAVSARDAEQKSWSAGMRPALRGFL
jgi:hypothetical protein